MVWGTKLSSSWIDRNLKTCVRTPLLFKNRDALVSYQTKNGIILRCQAVLVSPSHNLITNTSDSPSRRGRSLHDFDASQRKGIFSWWKLNCSNAFFSNIFSTPLFFPKKKHQTHKNHQRCIPSGNKSRSSWETRASPWASQAWQVTPRMPVCLFLLWMDYRTTFLFEGQVSKIMPMKLDVMFKKEMID